MARALAAETSDVETHEQVVEWYRRRLAEPAEVPWRGCRWEPVRIGPTWQLDGRHWLLPERTIGWDVLGWCGTELQHGPGRPWRFTMEQARFILWWYAVDGDGRWLFRTGTLQRLKGWGKDPLAACLLFVEALGPCRVYDMVGGQPVATDQPDAWAQVAAVSLEQTKNTMRLMPGLLTREAQRHYGVHVGRELVHALGDTRLIQAVTSSPATLEGARATFVVRNETHHWLAGNDGHEMAAVIERNATKSADGASRDVAITNAYDPSEGSVAQQDREAWELAAAGGSLTTGILYDSLEAPPDAPLTAEAAPEVVRSIRGDSVWLDVDRVVASILDTRNPPSRSRRFWYNQVVASEEAWVDPARFGLLARPDLEVGPDDELVVFFDGSKADDATGLVGCRVSDGHVVTLGVWQRPPGARGRDWLVPRGEVDLRVREVFEQHRVVALWADPSHASDDMGGDRYWDGTLDGWHRDFGDRLELWAVPGRGRSGHAVMWDMTSPARQQEFVAAAEMTQREVEDGAFTHDGHPRLVEHVRNARAYATRWGTSLGKQHRMSPRKVDLAVCMVGARMLRRALLNSRRERRRSGIVW